MGVAYAAKLAMRHPAWWFIISMASVAASAASR